MKRVIRAASGFESPGARSKVNQLYTKLKSVLDFLDANDEYLENLLDDPGFYDALSAEVRRLDSVLNGAE